MHNIVRRQPWKCAKCLCRQQRYQHSAAARATSDSLDRNAYLRSTADSSTDDTTLRDVFNKQAFWKQFSQSAKKSSGLIGNKYLTTPRGFQTFAEKSLLQCKKLVERTLSASTAEQYKALPRVLDRLSDLLCRVIDLSDFVRTNHPDPRMTAAATASYSMMYQYMNELNTTTGLNAQLKKATSIPEVKEQWSQEETIVAQILMRDFAKSGIDLPEKQRHEFVTLSNEIAEVGTDFLNQVEPAKSHIAFSKNQLAGVDPTFLKGGSFGRKFQVPVFSSIGRMIMASAHDPDTRFQLYAAERTASRQTNTILEGLLTRRAKLAKLTGYSNYGQMTLAEKMAKSPEAVSNFLSSLMASNKGQIHSELDQLLAKKKAQDPAATEVMPWDHSYILRNLSKSTISRSRLQQSSRNYFALGHVMQGLSSLFNRLYGIRFVPHEANLGEAWDPEVRRLDVLNDRNEHIATIYCDLFTRPGKSPNPAHFTLVCSREISEEEAREDIAHGEPLNNGMPFLTNIDQTTGKTTHYQIPVIALVCDFPDPHGPSGQPALLSMHSLITLFHEMGHAMHSVLGRTSMQSIAGTRCATDFAELPSILMEYFALDPDVLRLFARHWQTDEAMPMEMMAALKSDQKAAAERSGGWYNENQILMAMLDQKYHSSDPVRALSTGQYDSTAAYHEVWNSGSVHEPQSTAWQGFFSHLYGYGATYYAYLFDRAIARQVWRAVFRDGERSGAVDGEAGQRFKGEVLRWGGGRDPWLCLEGLMGNGNGVLAEGGERAMLEVGKWGIDASTEGQL